MRSLKSALAATELLLVFPAALFMTALFVRNLQPLQYEPARSAQRVVDWFAASPHLGLWVLLFALPLTVLFLGAVALVRAWRSDAELRRSTVQLASIFRTHFATVLIAMATFAAGSILAIVALHVISG